MGIIRPVYGDYVSSAFDGDEIFESFAEDLLMPLDQALFDAATKKGGD